CYLILLTPSKLLLGFSAVAKACAVLAACSLIVSIAHARSKDAKDVRVAAPSSLQVIISYDWYGAAPVGTTTVADGQECAIFPHITKSGGYEVYSPDIFDVQWGI